MGLAEPSRKYGNLWNLLAMAEIWRREAMRKRFILFLSGKSPDIEAFFLIFSQMLSRSSFMTMIQMLLKIGRLAGTSALEEHPP